MAPVRRYLPGLAFTAGYAVTLLWFYTVDVYHRHFSDAGLLVLANNFFRVVFIFYLFWMIHAAGAFLLQQVGARKIATTGVVSGLALRFFAGAGIWHVVLLVIGYLGLYTRPIAIAITVPVVALSFGHLRAVSDDIRWSLESRLTMAQRLGQWGAKGKLYVAIAGALFVLLFGAVLTIKGLYPGGGHDYFTHYFQFYRAVIERADIWPNEVWYQYYYSKGAGLFFLSVLLTDPLAPQLVTFCFYAVSTVVLLLLLRRIAGDTLWPWVAVALYLALFIYTPGPGDTRSHGGWGDFEKLHELNAALTLAILWMTVDTLERTDSSARAWGMATASAVVAAVIIHTTIAVYLGAIFAVLMVWYFVRSDRRSARICFAFAAVAGATAVILSAINYLTTGLINEQNIVTFWRFADVEQLARWGALPLAITTYWGNVARIAEGLPAFDTFKLVLKTLRLDMLGPLAAVGLTLAGAAWWRRRMSVPAHSHALVLTVAVAVALVLAVTAGRSQPVSFYRYTTFMLPIVLALGILLCVTPFRGPAWFSHVAQDRRLPAAAFVACLIAALISYHPRRAPADALFNGARFALGAFSIDRAYATQNGAPARPAYGAIYPGARGAYAIVGPHKRIWSMHTFSYCMLPDCKVETYPSVIIRDWDRVMFGPPEEGRKVLEAAGIDYVLFSSELYVTDPLPSSPLFAPENIARHLAVRWSDGTTTLLTWPGPDTRPIDAAWLANYRQSLAHRSMVQSFPYAAVRDIFARLRATPHPWRSFPLPW